MSPIQRLALVLALCVAVLGIASCGGDDGGGDEDPQELLDATFSNQESVDSGVFDLSLDVAAEGGENAGSFEASLGGPFQSTDGGFPEFDLDAELNLDSDVQDFSGEAGLTSAGDSAFVSFQGTDYEVPADAFREFTQSYAELQQQSQSEEEQGGNLLSSLGVDPSGWLTDLENEGTEDVEGTETVKITGTADVPKLVEDLRTLAENAPEAVGQQDLDALGDLTDVVESADFSFYTGSDDDILRKVEASLHLNPADSEGAPDSVDVDFSLTLSELNEPQEISAPADAQPLQGLLDTLGVQIPGSGTGGGGANALPEAGGSPTPPGDDATSAYLECLSTAEGDEATQQCAELLQ